MISMRELFLQQSRSYVSGNYASNSAIGIPSHFEEPARLCAELHISTLGLAYMLLRARGSRRTTTAAFSSVPQMNAGLAACEVCRTARIINMPTTSEAAFRGAKGGFHRPGLAFVHCWGRDMKSHSREGSS